MERAERAKCSIHCKLSGPIGRPVLPMLWNSFEGGFCQLPGRGHPLVMRLSHFMESKMILLYANALPEQSDGAELMCWAHDKKPSPEAVAPDPTTHPLRTSLWCPKMYLHWVFLFTQLSGPGIIDQAYSRHPIPPRSIRQKQTLYKVLKRTKVCCKWTKKPLK